MQIQVTHVVVHTPETVREIIAEAMKIADERLPEGGSWQTVFGKACDLLGQRFTLAAQPEPVPIDLGNLRTVRGGH